MCMFCSMLFFKIDISIFCFVVIIFVLTIIDTANSQTTSLARNSRQYKNLINAQTGVEFLNTDKNMLIPKYRITKLIKHNYKR